MERQITTGPQNHILTNAAVWSPDNSWIAYDVRSDPAGACFDGTRIEAVNVSSGETKRLFESSRGAHCGVATWHPHEPKVIFILGPENPTPDWRYSACHRQGMIVSFDNPGRAEAMDARDLTAPFTPGSLRGGSHVHVWDASGEWISFTYNDALVESAIRDVAIGIPSRNVNVKKSHPRNHDGSYFSMVISRTTVRPRPDTDEIQYACEESWVGRHGYLRPDGSRSTHALAFQGHVVTNAGQVVPEVFLCDVPEEAVSHVAMPSTCAQRPAPPPKVMQRRLTFTADRPYPGLQGPRHWLRSSPDGAHIACLMKDECGIVQLWLVSPNGGPPRQLTHNSASISSAFSWSPNGRWIAHGIDQCIAITDTRSGRTKRLTETPDNADLGPPRPESCVFSPNGRHIAFVRPVMGKTGQRLNQVFSADVPPPVVKKPPQPVNI